MDYLTVEGESEATFEIRRSVFICRVKGVESFDAGMEFVKSVSKTYSDATHNCYAVCAFQERKFSDDGEPQGTAGQPIIQTLTKRSLENVAAVVTRYFGGIKLGAGGLVTSYKQAVCDALDKAKIIKMTESTVGNVKTEYTEYRALCELIGRMGTVIDTEFGEGAEISFAVPVGREAELGEKISALTSGRVKPIYGGKKFVKYN